TLGGARITALEWFAYDRWLRTRAGAPVSAALVVVMRDPASEARFGAGSWDRAVPARLVTSLSRAGAAAIGLDVPLRPPIASGGGEHAGRPDRDRSPRGDDRALAQDRRRRGRSRARRLRRAGAAHGRAVPRPLDRH